MLKFLFWLTPKGQLPLPAWPVGGNLPKGDFNNALAIRTFSASWRIRGKKKNMYLY